MALMPQKFEMLKKAVQQGAASEGLRRYKPHFVWPVRH